MKVTVLLFSLTLLVSQAFADGNDSYIGDLEISRKNNPEMGKVYVEQAWINGSGHQVIRNPYVKFEDGTKALFGRDSDLAGYTCETGFDVPNIGNAQRRNTVERKDRKKFGRRENRLSRRKLFVINGSEGSYTEAEFKSFPFDAVTFFICFNE